MPSFRHIDRAIARDVREMGRRLDEGLRDTIPDSVERSFREAGRDVDRHGREAGRRYGDHFGRMLRRSLTNSLSDLPPLEIGAARNRFDQSLREVRAELHAIRDQHINLDIDDDEAIDRVRRVRDRMLGLEREASSRRDVANLRSAGLALDGFETLVRQAARSGREAGGNFGGAFGRQVRTSMERLLATLPEIPLRPDLTLFDHAMRSIRRQALALRDFRIGIDGDAAEFFRRVRQVQARIEQLRRANVSVDFNVDLDRARAVLRDFSNRIAPAAGEEAGEELGGHFHRTVHRRMEAAFRALPDIELDFDSGPVQIEISAIRDELNTLRNVRVGVDMDAAEVMRRVEVLQRRLRELSRQDVDIQVRADIAAAIAQLAAVAAVANQVDGSVAGIGTAANASLGRLGAMIAAGLSLGTILVPAAAAASVAVAGIAVAATAGIAGLGVLALGLSGVVTAVGALHKFQQDSDKSAKSMAQSQKQIASALDGVENAERALSNARTNAAYQQRQSARAIVDAQRAVIDAQKEARRAQLDLIEAIKEARQLDQDRALQLKSNALAQRQSTLDIADAKKELDKVLSDPKSSAAEREQARITYEQRVLQMDELRLRGQRLAEEQAEANRKGVMGSDRVQAAQRRVESTTQAVADAQRRVQDAIEASARQQQQSSEAIRSAQQQVEAAQRQVGQAFINSGVAGGEAMDNLQDSLRSLSPEAVRFVRYLYSFKDAVIAIRQAAERGMLPGFQAALREFQRYLPGIAGFTFDVARGLGEIAVQAVRSLQHPVWRNFFGYIREIAVPALKGMFTFSEAVARGLVALLLALSPFNRRMGQGLIDWAEGFATWAERLSDNQGMTKFLTYVANEGPRVVELLFDLFEMIKRIVVAAAPIGSVMLRAFDGLVTAINHIPIPILTLLLAYIGFISVRLLANAAIMGLWTRSVAAATNQAVLFSAIKSRLTGIMAVYTTAASAATTATGRLAAMTRIAAGSWALMRAAGAGMVGMLGGPVGIAIAVATIGIGFLVARSAQAKAQIDQLTGSLNSYGDALGKGVTRKSFEHAQEMLRQDKALRGLVTTVNTAGISQQKLVQALNGDREARIEIINALNRQIEEEKRLQREARGSADSETAASQKHKDRAEELEKLRIAFAKTSGANAEAADLALKYAAADRVLIDSTQALRKAIEEPTAAGLSAAIASVGSLSIDAGGKLDAFSLLADKVATSTLDAAQKAELFGDILEQIGSSTTASGPTFDALATTFANIAESSISARDKVDLLRQALEQMYGASRAQFEADVALVRSQQAFRVQLDSNSAGFDLNTARTGQNTEAILANIDALTKALEAAQEKYLQDIANGVAVAEARAQYDKTTKAIFDAIPPTQRNSQAVQDLNKRYGELPAHKSTQITTPGLDKAILELITAHAIQIGIGLKWDKSQINAEIDFLTKMINGKAGTVAMFKADGGIIEGHSPSKTADDKLAWLTSGEFVHPVDSVDYYGVDAMEAIRHRRIPRDAIAGYATGGFVGQRYGADVLRKWPVEFKPNLQIPDIKKLWAEWEAARTAFIAGPGDPGDVGAGPGFPPWPSAHPGRGGPRGDSGVWKSILNLVRQSGIPYEFWNAYRPGDPLWHGAGRAMDLGGYNQDRLASFFFNMRPRVLELIHRTNTRDYAITRGRVTTMPVQLPLHRNHIHIAMDQGGALQPGWNPPIWNGTGRVEPVLNPDQWSTVGLAVRHAIAGSGGPRTVNNFQFLDTTLTAGKLRAINAAEAAYERVGRAR